MPDNAGDRRLEPRIIRGSRSKALSLLAVSLALTVLVMVMVRWQDSRGRMWAAAVLAFLALGDLVFSWIALRPQTLSLDESGFTLGGGLMRRPRRFRWSDVSGFFVFMPPPAGGQMIGFNYAPGARPQDARVELNRSLGADEGLPQFWRMRPKEMAALLNAYRGQAMANPGATGVRASAHRP